MDNIIERFIENPEKKFHVRELSKLLHKSPTTISKYLKDYEKKGILSSERKFNHLLFSANAESRKFRVLKLNRNLISLENSGLIEFLEIQFNHPEAIILFGSFAKAENNSSSDIDIFILSPLKKEINLKTFEKKLNHNIQLFVHSNQDIQKMKEKNKELLNNIVNGITLYGFLEVFR